MTIVDASKPVGVHGLDPLAGYYKVILSGLINLFNQALSYESGLFEGHGAPIRRS